MKKIKEKLSLRVVILVMTVIALLITAAVPVFADSPETESAAAEGSGTGSLTVKKTAEAQTDTSYKFTVTLSDTSINGSFGMTFENGVAEFEIKDGEMITAEKLPSGVSYKVEIVTDLENISSLGTEGTIPEGGTAVAAFDSYSSESGSGFGLFDILLVPMGYVIRVCYMISHNYAVALLLFAVVMQLLLFPFGIKQQKNMNKQASLRPKENAIRKKYAGRNDAVTQKKVNEEIMALYQQENFNPASGCLPLLIQLPIIFALFYVVREPLKYITRLSANVTSSLTRLVNGTGIASAGYEQIGAVSYIRDNGLGAVGGLGKYITEETVSNMPNFRMFGGAFDLSVTPSSNIWSVYILVPILTFVFMYGSMKLTRKFTYQPQPQTGDAQNQASMKIMEMLSPLMCTYFAFIVPSAIGIYWMYRNILAFVQQVVLSKIYPTPRFTEEQLKEAEREYLGKTKKTKSDRDPNRPKPRSLHRIDFDDDDESAPASLPEPQKTAKKSGVLEAAPLKDDKKEKDEKDDKSDNADKDVSSNDGEGTDTSDKSDKKEEE